MMMIFIMKMMNDDDDDEDVARVSSGQRSVILTSPPQKALCIKSLPVILVCLKYTAAHVCLRGQYLLVLAAALVLVLHNTNASVSGKL